MVAIKVEQEEEKIQTDFRAKIGEYVKQPEANRPRTYYIFIN